MRFNFFQVKLSFPLHDTGEGEGTTQPPTPIRGYYIPPDTLSYLYRPYFSMVSNDFPPIFFTVSVYRSGLLSFMLIFSVKKVNNHQKFFKNEKIFLKIFWLKQTLKDKSLFFVDFFHYKNSQSVKQTGNKRYTKPINKKGGNQNDTIEKYYIQSTRFKLQPKPIL